MLTDGDDGRMTDAWLYYKLTFDSVELTVLKIIAVQITGLSNVGYDTGLAAVFAPKTRLKKKKKKKKKKTFMERFRFVSFSLTK